MSEVLQPGRLARRVVLRRALGAGAGAVVAAVGMRASRADDGTKVTIGNFAFVPPMLRDQGGDDGDLGEWRRHSAQHRLPAAERALASDGYQ